MDSKFQVISKNYNNKYFKIRPLTRDTFINTSNLLIFTRSKSFINNTEYSAGIYIPKPKEKVSFKGKGLCVDILNTVNFDIHGYFKPQIDNSNKSDELFDSKHTIIFSNSLFRPIDAKKVNKLKTINAFSNHLKAELVELFTERSMVPPHCHGRAMLLNEFRKKFGHIFNIKKLNENHAHPQIIFVVAGSGKVFLDTNVHNIQGGDMVIYRANTIHATKAGKRGLKFIHFGWKEKK